MADHSLPDDELLSSYLDGELTAEDVAFVEQRLADEPSLTNRLAELRDAVSLVSSPVAGLDPSRLDDLLATALAAAPGPGDTGPRDTGPGEAGTVTDLSAARRKRVWPTRLATVAAAVAALALTIPAIRAIDSGDSSSDAGSADRADEDSGGDDSDTAADGDDTAADDLALEVQGGDATDTMESGDDAASSGAFDDDMGSDDMGAEDMGSDDMAADGEGADADAEADFAPEAESTQNRAAVYDGFLSDDGFDPLDDELGEFPSLAAVGDTLTARLTAFREASPPTSTTTDDTDDSDVSDDDGPIVDDERLAERLTELGLGNCPGIVDVLATFLAVAAPDRDPDAPFAADFATATVAGEPVTIGLFVLEDDRDTALVIDPATCALTGVEVN